MSSITVDWNVFNYLFSGKQRDTFESLAYTLFCFEFNQKLGIFRYFNQPHIETQPIETLDGDVIVFQAKYYDAATRLSSKKNEIIEAIDGAKTKYGGITKFIIYTNKEFSTSKDKKKVKPDYQTEIENHGKVLGIQIEWRVTSNFEILLLDPCLSVVRELYFDPDSKLRQFVENIKNRSVSIINNINSSILYNDRQIKIDYPQTEIINFTNSDKSAFVIYGNAGAGKSGYVKDFHNILRNTNNPSMLVFTASDFDECDEIEVLKRFGNFGLEELLSFYDSEKSKYCIIDSAEKYCNFKAYSVFRSVVHKFIDRGWKIIFTIRKQYKVGFMNAILEGVSVGEFCIDSIDESNLKALSECNNFELPSNYNLRNLLCNLFYLKLYLKLLSFDTTVPSDTRSFTEQIWELVIRNDLQRRDNLPVRRETFIESMASSLLKNEMYFYRSQSSDDSEAILLLEEQGIIIPYNDTPGLWAFSHDVYEEIVVNQVFNRKYDESLEIKKIIEVFDDTLRSRKMYRIWLENKLRDPDSSILSTLTDALLNTELSPSWKDETIIALINSENDEAFQIMESLLSANSFALFSRLAFLLNTACKCIIRNNEYIKLFQEHKISTYRFTEPTGKAWHTFFKYISKHISSIPWNKKNISIVIEAMESWVKSNSTGEITSIVGHIALSLRDKIWQESEHRYGLYDDAIFKSINNIILLSAIEIKDELAAMVNNIISDKSFSHRDKDYIFSMRILSNIFECGNVCKAIPQEVLQLAWAYWVYKDENKCFSSLETESSFGLNDHLDHEYYPASSYQTPLFALLRIEPQKSIDFIIKLMNHAALNYSQSELNENYSECSEIEIIFDDKLHISQICSGNLWKIYRGTGAAPNVLQSILMALEEYLLQYVNSFTKTNAEALCFYLLKSSNNVAITAVILSAVIAYPDKLFDVSCVLLRTKELFHLDKIRLLSERESNYFKGFNPRYKLFDDERIKSNQQEFRKKKFEDIVLSYQINSSKLSESDFQERLEKLYKVIDISTTEIEKWHPIYQAYYYRIDLRKYTPVGKPIIKDKQISIAMKSDMPQQVVDYSKKSSTIFEKKFGYTELMLWASLRYRSDNGYRNYNKYEDNPILAYDTVKALLESENDDLPLMSIDTIAFTLAVLLRDFNNTLDADQYKYCKDAFLELSIELIKNSSSLLCNDDVKEVVITEIANQVVSSDKRIEWDNPTIILLAFILDYRKYLRNSMINPMSVLWGKNRGLATKIMFVVSNLFSLYDGKDVMSFVESHKEEIVDFLSVEEYSLDSIDVSNLDYNTLLYINNMMDNHDTNILTFVIKLGELFWEKLFNNDIDDKKQKIFVLEYEYKKWLAEFLLNLSNEKQYSIILELMPNVRFNRDFKALLNNIICVQDKNPRYEAFWNLWLSMQEYIFKMSENKSDYYKNIDSEVHIGYGFEDVLVTYLLADFYEVPGVDEWHSLKIQNKIFYMTAANRLGYNSTVLFSVARLLYTIGKKTFKDEGIIWLSEIIRNNPHLFKKTLPENTLFYIEEYMFSFVKEKIDLFQTNIRLKKKVVIVLDFLVERGSTVGYLLREEII